MLEQILLLVTLLSFPIVALVTKRTYGDTRTIKEFTLGRSEMTSFPIAAGISMSFVGGAATLNMASLGYQYGWSVLVDPIVVFIALILSASFANYIREGKGVTISDYLTGSSVPLKLILGITSFTVYQLLTAAQFVALGKLLSPFFNQCR